MGREQHHAHDALGIDLAAGQGTPVLLRVEGEDESAAADALADLFGRLFDEEV